MKTKSLKITNFKDLLAWQEGHRLVLLIYYFAKEFPAEEKYALAAQIKRAVVSVTSNISEGFGRQGYKEKIHFYYLAQGSLIEVKNHLEIAKDLHYISTEQYQKARTQSNHAHQLLQGLIKKTKSLLNPNS